MIALTKKAKYALKALVYLAARYDGESSKPEQASSIAQAQHIPIKFLEAILSELSKHGYLNSRKGRGGGYWLARNPNHIFLGAVIRIFEGPLAPIPCVSKRYYARCEDCDDEAHCEVRQVMLKVKNGILAVLDKTSIAEMMCSAEQPIQL